MEERGIKKELEYKDKDEEERQIGGKRMRKRRVGEREWGKRKSGGKRIRKKERVEEREWGKKKAWGKENEEKRKSGEENEEEKSEGSGRVIEKGNKTWPRVAERGERKVNADRGKGCSNCRTYIRKRKRCSKEKKSIK